MNERERLKVVMDSVGMNAKQFALEVGISAGTLSNIMKGRNRPSLDVMQAVLNRFRQVRSDWLILGSGSMSYGVSDMPQAVAEDDTDLLPESSPQPAEQPRRRTFVELSLFGDNEATGFTAPPAQPDTASALSDATPAPAPDMPLPGTPDASTTSAVPRSRPLRQTASRPRSSSFAHTSAAPERRLVRILLMYDDGTFEER